MIVTNAFYELVLELMPYQTMTNAYFLAVNTTVDPIKLFCWSQPQNGGSH